MLSNKILVKNKKNLAKESVKLFKKLIIDPKKSVFISDHKIWNNCKKFFPKNFLEEFFNVLILNNPKADEIYIKKIKESKKFDKNIQSIIGLGSGTINDLCKYLSAQTKIPYIIFPSAPSMNGYLSSNASITINNHKKTISATLPIAVFSDLEILKNSPTKLKKAGIGDMICFYGCWFDWYLSHKIFATKFDPKPFLLLTKIMKFFCNNFHKFSLDDEKFLKILMEILLLSGQGMTIAKGSYPASQSEHLIAHCLTMKFPEKLNEVLHGQLIAITTLTTAKIQNKVLKALKSSPKNLAFKAFESLDMNEYTKANLVKFFGSEVANECQNEFMQKIVKESDKEKILKNLELNHMKIFEELKKIYFPFSKIKEIFSHFKISSSSKSIKISNQQYQDCVDNAKFIRNRITCLDFFK